MRPSRAFPELPLAVERSALAVRYGLLAVILPFFLLDFFPGNHWSIAVISLMVLAHNAFVHFALSRRRHDLFFSTFNLILYVAEVTLVVQFSGRDSSDAYLLYFFLIIGFSVYVRSYKWILGLAVLCAGLYTAILLIEAWRIGLSEDSANLVVRILMLLAFGWLTAQLRSRIRTVEDNVEEQQARLVASETTLRTILNSAGDPILVFDDFEFITEVNDRTCEFLGASRDEIIGKRVRQFLFDDGTLPQKLADLRSRGEGKSEEIIVNAEGEERTVESVVRSFMLDDQRYFVSLLRDVTRDKQLQEATRLANMNLERLNRELRQVDELKTHFLISMSQHLRSPLAAVLGYVDMLMEEELGTITHEQRKALQTCRRALQRVFKLMDEALSAGQLEGRRSTPATAPARKSGTGSPGE
ncbi:MAG: hypothetical protein AMXMBFR84_00610 [Candidatus Hydrogenedentota bacterium]